MRRKQLVGIICTLLAGSGGLAYANPDLLDVVARIEYGFYAGDANVITAARAELERLSGSAHERAYYSAYAAWRLSQVDADAAPRLRRQRTDDCLAATEALVDVDDWAVEAHVLAAACALAAHGEKTSRGAGSHSKVVQSIDAARMLDPENPRLLLIAALALADPDSTERQAAQIAALEAALEQFDALPMELGVHPGWGRPEALVNLGAIQLARGNSREARDLIERALLEAPGYHFALQLKNALSLR